LLVLVVLAACSETDDSEAGGAGENIWLETNWQRPTLGTGRAIGYDLRAWPKRPSRSGAVS